MISCLCVTHERPEFMPWVEHQFLKQSYPDLELIIIDSSAVPWESSTYGVRVLHVPDLPGIAEKRTYALAHAAGYITWFDDDDWQHHQKCTLERFSAAFGSRHAYMFSTVTGKCSLYESTFEPIIFNSAVYRNNGVPRVFDASKLTGEDTEWQMRWLQSRPSYLTLGTPMHAWLCHGKNITNKANSRFFDLENNGLIPFDDWELEFLRKQFGSPV